MLHKSLGHVSYNRIRKKLGIPIDMPEKCRACAVVKITKSSFKHRSSSASKPFEEIHLDLIGPISPMSYQHHNDVFQSLTFAIDVEAKRLGYYPSVIHSDRGTEFTNTELENYCKNHIIQRFNRTIEESLRTILLDSGLRKSYWNEILTVSTLTLNQIPAHKSKKSPYEIFKGASIPIDFFHPVGNPVVFHSNKNKTKLEPRGEFGRLIGLNPELKSYKILANDGRIVNTKHVDFLEFSRDHQNMEHDNSDELVVEQQIIKSKDTIDNQISENQDNIEYGSSENEEIEEILIPQPAPLAGRTLRERTIQEIEYNPSVSDACLFIHKKKDSFIFFHVDDLIVVGKTDSFEKAFLERFPNSSAHSPDTLLGMNLNILNDSIELSQSALIQKGLELLNMEDCRPVKTPLTPAVQLATATEEDHQTFLKKNINYRSYTGMLNYLACRTRPDLAAAVLILSRFNQRPGLSHWKEVLHCWKYLKGTQHFGLLLKPDPSSIGDRIQFFTDATWAEDQETRLSQSGSLAFWKSCPILWNSKKQKNITMSSTESELNALSDGEQENQWLSFLIRELWKKDLAPTLFHVNNKGLMEKLKNFGANSKTKHLDIKIKNLREKYNNNTIDVKLIPSEDMVADALTKAAPHASIQKLQDRCLSVHSSSTMEGC
ncbi:hypothetical protein VP01_3263g3 [Puccinia sorghi]|uniref:Integrase catalytic domain-containing protein n=1 Tax=Puccinia sorghi TaxID=27349 RepID=A0A0L6UYS4_9BASI|nr:hypothetical protein VP01_3263g3 [Puccinia sorghi]